MAEFIFDPKMG